MDMCEKIMKNLYDSNKFPYESKERMTEIHNDLIVKKMKLNKQFSLFLESTELDETEPDTKNWKEYKALLSEYETVDHLLQVANFYRERNPSGTAFI